MKNMDMKKYVRSQIAMHQNILDYSNGFNCGVGKRIMRLENILYRLEHNGGDFLIWLKQEIDGVKSSIKMHEEFAKQIEHFRGVLDAEKETLILFEITMKVFSKYDSDELEET